MAAVLLVLPCSLLISISRRFTPSAETRGEPFSLSNETRTVSFDFLTLVEWSLGGRKHRGGTAARKLPGDVCVRIIPAVTSTEEGPLYAKALQAVTYWSMSPPIFFYMWCVTRRSWNVAFDRAVVCSRGNKKGTAEAFYTWFRRNKRGWKVAHTEDTKTKKTWCAHSRNHHSSTAGLRYCKT